MQTIPNVASMRRARSGAHDYMRPNMLPSAVVLDNWMAASQCDALVEYMEQQDHYNHEGCDALTREAPMPLADVFDPVILAAVTANASQWQFDLDPYPAAWMQSYESGGSYQLHVDQAPGQMRKLTAVAMLSDPADYVGGDLIIRILPHDIPAPKSRGTVVVFPSWVLHYVTPISRGFRQTINLGFWGPPFR